jgi:hypothetical protein
VLSSYYQKAWLFKLAAALGSELFEREGLYLSDQQSKIFKVLDQDKAFLRLFFIPDSLLTL